MAFSYAKELKTITICAECGQLHSALFLHSRDCKIESVNVKLLILNNQLKDIELQLKTISLLSDLSTPLLNDRNWILRTIDCKKRQLLNLDSNKPFLGSVLSNSTKSSDDLTYIEPSFTGGVDNFLTDAFCSLK